MLDLIRANSAAVQRTAAAMENVLLAASVHLKDLLRAEVELAKAVALELSKVRGPVLEAAASRE